MANISASLPRPAAGVAGWIRLAVAAQAVFAACVLWLASGSDSALLAWLGCASAAWMLLSGWICHRLAARLAVAERAAAARRQDSAVLQQQLTQQSLALERTKQALRRAEQACLDKTRFLAAASHDLRQPMHAISLFVAALKAEHFEGRPHYLLDRLDRSIAGLDELFNRLLDLARLDAGIITPAVRTFDARIVMEALEARFAPVAASKSLDFRMRCPAGLLVRSDPELLVELLSNLLSNAFRNTRRGGVLLALRERGGSLLIQVVDTGCGIPEDCFESIFDEFVQLNNPSRDRRKGSGLGLAIVRRLADALGHRIRLRSRVGRGSCFELQMPCVPGRGAGNGDTDNDGDIDGESEGTQENASPLAASALNGALALVVDDEADILAAMEAILNAWGCHCITARSPDEAARYIDDSPRFPDVIISDHRLDHHMTSFDVAAAVAPLLAYEVPLIMISGESSPGLEKQAQDMGWAFISKPVNAARLRRAVEDALAKTSAAMDKAA